MTDMYNTASKTTALLKFLAATASLRRKRIPAYGESDKLLWLVALPRDLPHAWRDACRSAFIAADPADDPDLWLEVRKKAKPPFPSLSEELRDWVPQRFQDHPDQYIDKEPDQLLDILNPQITVVTENLLPNSDPPPEKSLTPPEKIPKRRLEECPQVKNAWHEYLVNKWKPWAQEMRRWKQVQTIYEDVDFMRRRLEEAEEQYELLVAVGLLQWRDSTGATVKRHLLTAPAEISLDAARSVLTINPAASFQCFRVELDMLEPGDRPGLEDTDVEDRLDELDVRAWDKAKVAEILSIIANRARADGEVDGDGWAPLERTDDTFRVLYAPAFVLRQRRSTAYEELIRGFLKASEEQPGFSTTTPWRRFVSEGEPSGHHANDDHEDTSGRLFDDTRVYFPLPTNHEQRRIAECLNTRPYVLVKGPPGTGKSHTIANLICHLLARGEKVLVTAHAPKALTVLRDLLPGDIRNLCVSAFGSSREDLHLLEESVRGILARKNEWRGRQWVQKEIDRLERELCTLEDEIATVDRQIRESREAETHFHTQCVVYRGTRAQIARQIENQRTRYSWFPNAADRLDCCPLSPKDVEILVSVHSLTQDRVNELQLEIGTEPLPTPDEFGEVITRANSAESEAAVARGQIPEEQLNSLQRYSDSILNAFTACLQELEQRATHAKPTIGDQTDEIVKEFLVGSPARWERLQREADAIKEKIQSARQRAGNASINIPPGLDNSKLLHDADRRLTHLKKGGWRGWGVVAPRVMRETRYIERRCSVNGAVPRKEELLDRLVGYAELREQLRRFDEIWPGAAFSKREELRGAADEATDWINELSQLVTFFKERDRQALDVVPIEKREALSQRDGRQAWRSLIAAELARRAAETAREPLDRWGRAIRTVMAKDRCHPCMKELAKAVEVRDVVRWSKAWEIRESLIGDKRRLEEYERVLGRVEGVCSELVSQLRSSQGDLQWTDRLRDLRQAWDWAAASTWLHKVSAKDQYALLGAKRDELEGKAEKTVEELATSKAWQMFFTRLDDWTEQCLVAWTKAVARIGKGTGKYAYRHRRTARKYLMECIPKMPAWIMPLHKVWETTRAEPGLFDTIIVDEASQAGIEALVLLLLAKRIVVVGDDQQNSPEAVGVFERDIVRLAREHIAEFEFCEEFRPDTSLYDHAERAFGNVISLREHFRCVPEIIRFSNDLCYGHAPLIPLRQAPAKRLLPLRAEFVEQGMCEGDGQRIRNRAEADAIVERIRECLNDDAYEGKTMGVIVLQGHAQAELVESRLAEVLEPWVREERKLRCGVPATFQGDQRDVIFLSLVVAPNHSFRALTELEAQRRFNVAMSRARDQVWLFHSVQQHDLNREDLRWRLLHFFQSGGWMHLEGLYEELDRLEREAKSSRRRLGAQPDPYESWFEVNVALELLRRGYRVRPQVEVAGYRIDLVVEGLLSRLAVECDGEAWHGPERFEQDMARQRQLERAGWKFARVRQSDFYADREGAVRWIVEACKELGIRPSREEEEEKSGSTVSRKEGLGGEV